eukprot:1157219-Pelagomonas_calceolata.AAC.1
MPGFAALTSQLDSAPASGSKRACTSNYSLYFKNENYVGRENLTTFIKEKGPHRCTDRVTSPPQSSD